MIKRFCNAHTEKLWKGQQPENLPADMHQRALNKLAMLNSARELGDLHITPENGLQRHSGDRADRYSLRINQKWRLTFSWRSGAAYDVDIVA